MHLEVRNLLLVGANEDNEIAVVHPLMRALEAIRQAGSEGSGIVLAPSSSNDIVRLVADALHCVRECALFLAQLVHEKTDGNPFFAIQFLQEPRKSTENQISILRPVMEQASS
jgi:predicted ATPase